jgi:hypothetical protein
VVRPWSVIRPTTGSIAPGGNQFIFHMAGLPIHGTDRHAIIADEMTEWSAEIACRRIRNCDMRHGSKEGPLCALVDALVHCPPSHRFTAAPKALPDKGAPNGTATPPAPGTPLPLVWHAVAFPVVETGGDGLEEGS